MRCQGKLENSPGKKWARCTHCQTTDYDGNEGDACQVDDPRPPTNRDGLTPYDSTIQWWCKEHPEIMQAELRAYYRDQRRRCGMQTPEELEEDKKELKRWIAEGTPTEDEEKAHEAWVERQAEMGRWSPGGI